MKRGDVVSAVFPRAYGKPRPALLIQDDAFEALPSATILPITSDIRDLPTLRVNVPPGSASGLKRRSQVMVDKVQTVARDKLGRPLGSLDPATLAAVEQALTRFLGLRAASDHLRPVQE